MAHQRAVTCAQSDQRDRVTGTTTALSTGSLDGPALHPQRVNGGCRVSDVCWFQLDQIHALTKKTGSITVGYKRGQLRTLDLANDARKALRAYLEEERNHIQTACPFVFLSQRKHAATTRHQDHPERLTEGGLHAWWRSVKEQASRRQWQEIANITFHDLRHDFVHLPRQAGWSLEEIAYYLGHTTKKGTPAIGTTARYTQVSRGQVKDKLKYIKG